MSVLGKLPLPTQEEAVLKPRESSVATFSSPAPAPAPPIVSHARFGISALFQFRFGPFRSVLAFGSTHTGRPATADSNFLDELWTTFTLDK